MDFVCNTENSKRLKDVFEVDELEELFGNKNESFIIAGATSGGHELNIDLNFLGNSVFVQFCLKIFGGKEYVYREHANKFLQNKLSINVGPLLIELREPFIRFRITFYGFVKDSSDKNYLLKFCGWWACSSDPIYFLKTVSNVDVLRIVPSYRLLATQKLLKNREDFIQYGSVRSNFEIIDDANQILFSTICDFYGSRLRLNRFSIISTIVPCNVGPLINKFAVENNFLNGEKRFSINLSNSKNSKSVQCSWIYYADHRIGNDEKAKAFTISSDKTNNKSSTFYVSNNTKKIVQSDGDNSAQYEMYRIEYFVQFSNKVEDNDNKTHNTSNLTDGGLNEDDLNFISLTDPSAAIYSLTGGKVTNLAKIIQQYNETSKKFRIPNGVVITTKFYQHIIDQNAELKKLINELTKLNIDKSTLEQYSQSIFVEFTKIKIDQILKDLLNCKIDEIFDQNVNLCAVRSSAIGEDGAEFSAAGQLETYLKIPRTNIIDKIVECWISNFRLEILTYRFENCLPLNLPTAVLVQEMITDGSSGVMFTCNPVQNNPTQIVLNLISEVGDALVSGQVVPTQVILKTSPSGKIQLLSSAEDIETPIPIEKCIELGIIGKMLQCEIFEGLPQDIEFAVESNGTIAILQSRNITNLRQETLWELEHEFDSALFCENDSFTNANIREVLTSAQCPLHISMYNYFLASAIYSFLASWERTSKNSVGQYALAGCKILSKEMFEFAKLRFPPKKSSIEILEFYSLLKLFFIDSKKHLQRSEKWVEQCARLYETIKSCGDNLQNIFCKILELSRLCNQVCSVHTKESTFSAVSYSFVAMCLKDPEEFDLSTEILSDISTIYSRNPLNLVSSDMSASLQKIVNQLREDKLLEKFSELSDSNKDAQSTIDWFLSLDNKCGTLMKEFLKKHGHRGHNELQYLCKAWESNPRELVDMLKAIIKNENVVKNSTQNQNLSNLDDDIIANLKTKLTSRQRYFLKKIIPHAHRSVWSREESKNHLVFLTHHLRKSFRLLADEMFKQRVLPDPELIFFLTLYEIKQIIYNGNNSLLSTLISRSRRRRRILGTQEEQIYALTYIGVPHPEPETLFTESTSEKLFGTCVCEGIVTGVARVAHCFEDAKNLVPGEILITKCTDVAWSPFFSVIKGLVTEMGGLLSHGAVVAREHSLPCIIAIPNVVARFKTGDVVILNATNGYIQLKQD